MGTVYKIHPAVGIAGVGNHPNAFFVGRESNGSPGAEIAANGDETTVQHYKSDGWLSRQRGATRRSLERLVSLVKFVPAESIRETRTLIEASEFGW